MTREIITIFVGSRKAHDRALNLTIYRECLHLQMAKCRALSWAFSTVNEDYDNYPCHRNSDGCNIMSVVDKDRTHRIYHYFTDRVVYLLMEYGPLSGKIYNKSSGKNSNKNTLNLLFPAIRSKYLW